MSELFKGNILVVDDQKNWRNALQAILKKTGFEVVLASTIDEAQTIIRKQQFHVAVVDVRLRDKDIHDTHNVDGIKLLREIKKQHPQTQTIIITAYPNDVKNQDEPDVFVVKAPKDGRFKTKKFVAKVEELVKKAKTVNINY